MISTVVPAEWEARRDELKSGMDPVAARALGLQLMQDHLTPVAHQLGDIDCPTTVLVGELDGLFAAAAPDLTAAIPNAVLHVIDGAFHRSQLSHPAQWLAAIEAHLGRISLVSP